MTSLKCAWLWNGFKHKLVWVNTLLEQSATGPSHLKQLPHFHLRDYHLIQSCQKTPQNWHIVICFWKVTVNPEIHENSSTKCLIFSAFICASKFWRRQKNVVLLKWTPFIWSMIYHYYFLFQIQIFILLMKYFIFIKRL